eukprot:TRINITY_DN10849_c0_g1_i2.p1 TRINITY_DN10849_c0_g1~~TRINITY_DN10849_c0_g1_i2.p1  ORF type:complete len:231 (+),score=56.12 TRINITY_DN10849_c0_g1_i2:28-693(+)
MCIRDRSYRPPSPQLSQDSQSQPLAESTQSANPEQPAHVDEDQVEQYPDGSVYNGNLLNGLRHGRGKFYYKSGGMYEGDWVQGKMEGFGTLFYGNGMKAYEGDWREDKFHGRGIMYSDAPQPLNQPYDFRDFDLLGDFWVRYEGDFMHDAKHGFGRIVLSNGEFFDGEFRDDKLNGEGQYHNYEGRTIYGEWQDNKLVRFIRAEQIPFTSAAAQLLSLIHI